MKGERQQTHANETKKRRHEHRNRPSPQPADHRLSNWPTPWGHSDTPTGSAASLTPITTAMDRNPKAPEVTTESTFALSGTPRMSVAHGGCMRVVNMINPVIVSPREWHALSQRRAYQQAAPCHDKRSGKRCNEARSLRQHQLHVSGADWMSVMAGHVRYSTWGGVLVSATSGRPSATQDSIPPSTFTASSPIPTR